MIPTETSESVRGLTVYRAKLKSRKQIKAEIPREQQGWWADVCDGDTLELRDATDADLARCYISEGQTRDPADYLCETFKGGCLVKRIAVAKLTVLKNKTAALCKPTTQGQDHD